MGSQPEKLDFKGDPKVGQGPRFLHGYYTAAKFCSKRPCPYQASPYCHQCIDKVLNWPATIVFNDTSNALGHLFLGLSC